MLIVKLEKENLKPVSLNKGRYIGVIGRITDSNFGRLLLVTEIKTMGEILLITLHT